VIFNKKRAVSVILSKEGKSGRRDETEVASESGEQDQYTAAAESILAAIGDKSVQRLAAVLRSLHEEDENEGD
jgi:hypothetical protein